LSGIWKRFLIFFNQIVREKSSLTNSLIRIRKTVSPLRDRYVLYYLFSPHSAIKPTLRSACVSPDYFSDQTAAGSGTGPL
jgi:hypothetical protein